MHRFRLLVIAGFMFPASLALAPGTVAAEQPPEQVSTLPLARLCRLDGTVLETTTGRNSTDSLANARCQGLRAGQAQGKKHGMECSARSLPLWWPYPNDWTRSYQSSYIAGYDASYRLWWDQSGCDNRPPVEPYYPPLH